MRSAWVSWQQKRMGNAKATIKDVPLNPIKEHLTRHGGFKPKDPRKVKGFKGAKRGIEGFRLAEFDGVDNEESRW